MTAMQELSLAVRERRVAIGMSQAKVAQLSGLSRVTVNQVEKGTIKDLSMNRASKLLDVLGLKVVVPIPSRSREQIYLKKGGALQSAAQTASVSYREILSAEVLLQVFLDRSIPKNFKPHVFTLLEEAPISLLGALVEELHAEHHLDRADTWQQMREFALQMKTLRQFWL